MPSLAEHQSSKFTKLLLIGDSGSGKTGALTSLVKAGYKLRVLDMDNGLDPLRVYCQRDCPDKLGNVEFRTLRDNKKATPTGSVIDGQPKAFVEALKMLDHWKYPIQTSDSRGLTDVDTDVDLGKPAEWGEDTILVIDSLTFLSDAAWDFREPLVPRSKDGKYDVRMVYKDAQDAIADVLGLLTSESFRTNVIVTAHIRYVDNADGTMKGYPTSVGAALSPTIPRYFNSTALCLTQPGGKRTIQTVATALVDLKNPAAFKMAPQMPIETGLADFFKTVRS
jgi:hypothetical protein